MKKADPLYEPLQPANVMVTVMTCTTQADAVMQALHIRRRMTKSEVANSSREMKRSYEKLNMEEEPGSDGGDS